VNAINNALKSERRVVILMEALFAGDMWRALSFALDIFFDMINIVNETEKKRIASNIPALQGYALATLHSNPTPTLNPTFVQDGVLAMTQMRRFQSAASTTTTSASSSATPFFQLGAGSTTDASLDSLPSYLPFTPVNPSTPVPTHPTSTSAVPPPPASSAPPQLPAPPPATQQPPDNQQQQQQQRNRSPTIHFAFDQGNRGGYNRGNGNKQQGPKGKGNRFEWNNKREDKNKDRNTDRDRDKDRDKDKHQQRGKGDGRGKRGKW
jgi:hypothetical protein